MLRSTLFSIQRGLQAPYKDLRIWKLLLVVIICFVNHVVNGQLGEFPPLTFSAEPVEGAPLEEGTTKYLICKTSSVPVPNYRWLKDGVYISEATTSYSHKIQNVARTDEGVYRCEASNELGTILSSGARLNVAYMDEFVNKDQTIYIRTNQSAAAVIPLPHIDSYPFPTITWFENLQTMNDVGQRHHVTLNKTLVLLDRDIQDSNYKYHPEAINGNTGGLQMGPFINVTVASVPGLSSRIAPVIVISPVDKVVSHERDAADFECVVNARPVSEVLILWYKIDSQGSRASLSAGSKYLIGYTNRTLTVLSPDSGDDGVYECEAQLPGLDTVVKAHASLSVYVSPSFTTVFPSEYNQDLGDTISIPCMAQGTPIPTIHWYYNARDLNLSTDPRYTLHSNGTLTVYQLDLEHAGVYQCFIRNEAGETSKSTWLKVNSAPPTFIKRPTDVAVIERHDAKFQCETQGAPKPVVTWSRDIGNGFEDIVNGGRLLIINGHELLITTTQSSDSGQYRCNASNSQGSVIAIAQLAVFIQTQIIRPPQNQTITKSTTVVFPCGVSHDQAIVVTWIWSFRAITQNQGQVIVPDGNKRTVDADGTLRITGINNGDIGNYTCDVVSSGGNDSRTVTLKVIEKPFPPIITSVALHPTDVGAVIVSWSPQFDGNTPILRYSIEYKEVGGTSSPDSSDPNAGWHPTNLNIGANDRSVTVSSLKPARRYQFRLYAENIIGEGDPSDPKPEIPIEMPQQPPSSPPKGFFGLPASNSSIYLQWQPPDEDMWNGPLLGYTIQHKKHNYDNNTFSSVNVSNLLVKSSYELGGLAFYEEYDIQIAAFNIKGTGVFSNMIKVRTLEGRPTATPKELQVTAYNSTTLEVTWKPPDAQFINGRNRGYKVHARIMGAGQSEIQVPVPPDSSNPTGTHRTFLYDLHKYTEYSVTVLCYTSQGDGPKTLAVVTRTQEDVPGMVGSLNFFDIRDTWLNVNWTEPTEINGVLQGYTLMYMEKDDPSTLLTRNLSSTRLHYTVTGLKATTKYTISVYASTRKGPGPARSADIESGIPPELPRAPFSLGVANIRANSVLLQFIPGFDGKTSITLWIVEAVEVEESSDYKEIYQISDPTARSIQVENLRPYTKYKLRVIAVNIVGRSNASLPTREFQTLQAAPGIPPGSVTVRALNATALRVSWTPLSKREWNGEARGYKVFYKMIDDVNFISKILDNGVNLDSTILGGLEEWIEYQVKMIAFNNVGDSAFSPVTVERTRESVPSAGPTNVSATVLGSTNVSVSWQEVPKFDQNGLIQGYKVQYQSRKESIAPEFEDVGGTTMSVVLQNLRKFVQYEIQVLAYTRMGEGILSSPEVVVKTDEDVPGPPVIIWFPEVSYTLAEVAWQPPVEPNGIIIGYMVSYKLHDSQDLYVNSSVLLANTTSYTVGNLQREAYYEFRVKAKTRLGWGETASVEVYTMVNRRAPDSPEKPSIRSSQINARTVTISWVKAPFNGYGPTRNFTVQYKLENNAWTTVPEAIMPSVTTYTVKGLSPNSRYVFRVAATNDIGMSPFSVQSDPVTTLEDKPEGAPRFVAVTPLTTTSVRVSWEQPLPATWNGVIIGYIINYKQADLTSYQEVKVTVDQSQKVLDNLIKFKNYEFIVTAYNSIGNGPASTPVTVYVGEAAPTAPPMNIRHQALNSTEILVTWDPPPPETQNGELSGYKIYYWPASSSESTAKQNITRAQNVLLRDLEIFTDYAIVIQAFNLAGEGPKSSIIYQKTKEGLPGKPASLNFWNVTYVSLDINWTPPLQPNGIITSYELSYLEGNPDGGSKQVKFDLNGTRTFKHITDLSQEFNYNFSLQAYTSVGQGEEITKSVVTGPQPGSPGKPQTPILQVSSYGSQFVKLVWNAGHPGDYPTYGYRIESKTKDADNWDFVLETDGQDTFADISFLSLNPDRQYQFRVTALNIIGISQHSEPSELFRTPASAFCGAGLQTTEDQTGCVPCPEGYFKPSPSYDPCTECVEDYTSNEARTACPVLHCGPGKYAKNEVCEVCATGSYKAEAGNQACTPCPSNKTTAGNGSVSENSCTIVVCGPGYYREPSQTNSCTKCPLNQYQDLSGQTSCKSCGNGTVTMQTGSANITQCVTKCKHGEQYNSDSKECEPCPQRYYKEIDGNFEKCKECPLGNTTVGTGSISEANCTQGDCNAGAYVTVTNNQVTCIPCPKGKYQPESSQTACLVCADGKITLATGSSRQTQCVVQCQAGEELVYVSSYPEVQQSCRPCQIGMYNDAKGANPNRCKDCPTGYTATAPKQSECLVEDTEPRPQPYPLTVVCAFIYQVNTDCSEDSLSIITVSIRSRIVSGIEKRQSRYTGLCGFNKTSCGSISVIIRHCNRIDRRKREINSNLEVAVTMPNISSTVVDRQDNNNTLQTKNLVVELFEANPEDFSLPNAEIVYGGHTEEPRVTPVCEPGHMITGESCTACQLGQYLDDMTRTCSACAENHYQDETAQTACKLCPDLTYYDSMGATSVSDCKYFCTENPIYCNSHGTCIETGRTTATCTCNMGYVGDHCETTISTSNNDAIIGGVVGGVCGILTLILIIVGVYKCLMRCDTPNKKQRHPDQKEQEYQYYIPVYDNRSRAGYYTPRDTVPAVFSALSAMEYYENDRL